MNAHISPLERKATASHNLYHHLAVFQTTFSYNMNMGFHSLDVRIFTSLFEEGIAAL